MNNKKINALTPAEIETLKAIGDHPEPNLARSLARGPLCFFYNICYEEEPAFEGTSNRQSASIPFSQSSEYGITVFPNPAAEYVVFSVVDNPQIVLSSIQISDMTGKPIYQSNFDSELKQHIWDTRNISNGNYIYTLIDMSGMKYSGKVTIRHNQ